MLRKCGNSINYDRFPKLFNCNFITASYKISDFSAFLLLRVIKDKDGTATFDKERINSLKCPCSFRVLISYKKEFMMFPSIL
jgi:hypothetical protein